MAFSVKILSTLSSITFNPNNPRDIRSLKRQSVFYFPSLHFHCSKHHGVFCRTPPWDPSPVAYSPTNDTTSLLAETPNIFETLSSESNAEAPTTNLAEHSPIKQQSTLRDIFLKWPMWLLGPALLLATGMIPTLWLPLSSVFLGPNIASLLSLVGLDCIFNLGATLFLLMADSNARPEQLTRSYYSEAPFSYRFWNMVAATTGFVTPLVVLFGSNKGSFFLQPQMTFIPFAVLFGPYLLLLSVQVLTEMLTWHWKSPVWLMTPVVYEGYRILQLMRALKLGAEMSAPAWILHSIRGLVCWWVFILGVQLMRVAWFAGFSVWKSEQEPAPGNGQ